MCLTTVLILEQSNQIGYLTGIVIALFVFGYLIYALVKPEKF